tara:strand:- start:355 stop:1749 length:1395 start_codon:yes stop_codon:yes gene_type:complete
MATHDYVLANQSGSSFRTDLNNALAAIVSNNSNGTEPGTKYAYQYWADTSSGTLKIRNAANNAWIELFQLDGTLTIEDGTESSPGLGFRDDLNTGIWSSAADTFNISTGGTERLELGSTTVFNESGADVDFRIEGDTDANLFCVNAGDNTVGIGMTTPTRIHNLAKVLEISGGDGGDLIIGNSASGNVGAGAHIGAIAFKNIDSAGSQPHYAGMRCEAIDTSGNMDLRFYTGSANLEADTPQIKLWGNTYYAYNSNGYIAKQDNYDADGGKSYWYDGGSGNNVIQASIDGTTGNIMSKGNFVVGTAGKGIDFSASSDVVGDTSELLDDYEQGNSVANDPNNNYTFGTAAGAYQYFSYTKVGSMVCCHGQIHIQSGSGWFGITLPFAPKATWTSGGQPQDVGYANGAVRLYNIDTPSDGIGYSVMVTNGSTQLALYASRDDATSERMSNISSGSYLAFSITYTTD